MKNVSPYEKVSKLRKAYVNCWLVYIVTLAVFCLLISINLDWAKKLSSSMIRYSYLITNSGVSLGLFTGPWPKDIYTALMLMTLMFGLVSGVLSFLIQAIPFNFNPINYGKYLTERNNGFYTIKLFGARVLLVLLGITFGFILWFSYLNTISIPLSSPSWALVDSFLIFGGFTSFIVACQITIYLIANDLFNFFTLFAKAN